VLAHQHHTLAKPIVVEPRHGNQKMVGQVQSGGVRGHGPDFSRAVLQGRSFSI
jgi:hypothetical protein